jgi:hypothetical protein
VFDTVVAMCQLALAELQKSQDKALTRDQIVGKVDEMLALPTFSSVDRAKLIERLEEVFTVWSNAPRILEDDRDHMPWLPAKRGEIEWRFWNRYKLFLVQDKRMEPATVTNIERVVDDVLSRLEDPSRAGPWDRRGLVMGNVQSGKTGAYTGLVCKAADAGYKVVIILAGLHNNLRSQTQIRLDEGFLGYQAVPPAEAASGFRPVGVYRYGPGLRADCVTNRNEAGDFRRDVANNFAIHPGGNPLLFVVKKNVTILKHLLAWIDHSADATDSKTGRRYHRNTPVLIIDDESDQASIDTKGTPLDENGQPNPEHDPTKTNKLIRSLLYSFDKSACVGFTATPFANIFIYENARTEEHGEDLFPRSFILNLPAPSNYVGAGRLFGIEEDAESGLESLTALPIARIIDDHAASLNSDETKGWMPPKLELKTEHVPLVNGVRAIPDSLKRAVMSFVIASAVRSIREAGPIINSMLVHVVRYTRVQDIVREEIETAVREMVNRLQHGDGQRKPTIQQEFEALWRDDFVPTSGKCGDQYVLPNWAEVRAKLAPVAASVVVKSINGSALDSLDYELHRAVGLNVIAVGGDKLSRGLTLDGLTVSYFLRASRMYDTLMQMGRWFGYRETYMDVCRLFTTDELVKWFKHIAAASEELKREFDYMVSIGATPREYGLRVRSHPVLLVTSAVKMRSGTQMRLSYSGDISETVVFDLKKVKSNLASVQSFLARLGRPREGKKAQGYTWTVGADEVLQFLAQYDGADAPRANPSLWTQYIRRQNEQGELRDWTVCLVSSGLSNATDLSRFFLGLSVGGIDRKANETSDTKHSIGRLVSPTDELRDLTDAELERALERTIELWDKDTRKNKSPEQPDSPSGKGIRFARAKERGLLLVYPLTFGPDEPLIGVAISFPESMTAKEISYMVTSKYAEDADYGVF